MEDSLGGAKSRFWGALATVTAVTGAWTYYKATRSYTSCRDGHCPDPGTREYLAGVQTMNENALQTTLVVMLTVVALGLILQLLLAWLGAS